MYMKTSIFDYVYLRLQKETFEGLSQEALSVCISTLKLASSQISTKTVRYMHSYFDLHALMGRMGSSGQTEYDYWNYSGLHH